MEFGGGGVGDGSDGEKLGRRVGINTEKAMHPEVW